ncbi:MAG: hypothetical protein WAW85_11685 [Gordonia sp. (in: high G+C Gram-positive bacteria)]|uniref:hypothetical protein n=1 Tax=Gordonia sp. (in: high G+C Gram-positive bacteria) TaxID=84139 RepID=UPI003BB7F2F1
MLAVTGLTVVVILAVVSTFILMGDDDTPETSAPPPQRSGTAEPNPPEDLDGKFDIPTVDIRGREVAVPKNPWGQVLPQTGKPSGGDGPPDGLMWQRVVAIPMPFSTSAGPTRISATGVPSGFSRTPDGAVLAAWQLGWRLAAGPREMREALMASSVQFSPDYAATQRAAYDELPDSFGPTELRGFDNIPDYINVCRRRSKPERFRRSKSEQSLV